MLPLVAGAAALLLLMFVLRGYSSADPNRLATLVRRLGAGALGGLAAFLAVRGRFDMAAFLGAIAWALWMGQRIPWPFGQSGGSPSAGDQAPPRRGAVRMSRKEALQVLELREGCTKDEVRAAHRRLILKTHPDHGGSSYLAAKINEAKDVLLEK